MSYLSNVVTTWQQAENLWDDFLDIGGDVTIAGIEFQRSRILREVDPIAYRCGLNDFLDGEGIDSDDLDGDRF